MLITFLIVMKRMEFQISKILNSQFTQQFFNKIIFKLMQIEKNYQSIYRDYKDDKVFMEQFQFLHKQNYSKIKKVLKYAKLSLIENIINQNNSKFIFILCKFITIFEQLIFESQEKILHRIDEIFESIIQLKTSMHQKFNYLIYLKNILYCNQINNPFFKSIYQQKLVSILFFCQKNQLLNQAQHLKQIINIKQMDHMQDNLQVIFSKIEKKNNKLDLAIQHLKQVSQKNYAFYNLIQFKILKYEFFMNIRLMSQTYKPMKKIIESLNIKIQNGKIYNSFQQDKLTINDQQNNVKKSKKNEQNKQKNIAQQKIIDNKINDIDQREILPFKFAKFMDFNYINPGREIVRSIIYHYIISLYNGEKYVDRSFPRLICLYSDLKKKWIEKIEELEMLNLKLASLKNHDNKQYYQEKINQIAEDIDIGEQIEYEMKKLMENIQEKKLFIVRKFMVQQLSNSLAENLYLIGLYRLANTYIEQSVWWLLNLKHFNYRQQKTNNLNTNQEKCAQVIIKNLTKQNQQYLQDCEQIFLELIQIKIDKKISSSNTVKLRNFNKMLVPLQKQLNYFEGEPVYITGIKNNLKIMCSKDEPAQITLLCSDQKERKFLIKNENNSDFRKEEDTMNCIYFFNRILKTSGLQMNNFTIIAMTKNTGIIEWVDETKTLYGILTNKEILKKQYYVNEIQNVNYQNNGESQIPKLKYYQIINSYKPQLLDYLLKQNDFYEKLINYTKSLAVSNIIGYLINLGDRHLQNLLFDNQFHIIHIDYECVFNYGKGLPIPEIVDFRFTKEIKSALGALGTKMISLYMEKVATIFLKNQERIMRFIEIVLQQSYFEVEITDYKQQIQEFKQKLTFKLQNHDIKKGVQYLLDKNSNDEILRQMYVGWSPQC